MTTVTAEDAIKAASSVARDIADGNLAPDALERQAVAELSQLMLIEPEPGSDLERLQAESARRVLARGGISTDELAEWLAVQRRRENPHGDQDDAEPADGAGVLLKASSDASVAHSGENDTAPDDTDLKMVQLAAGAEPEPAAPPSNRRILARGRSLPVDPGLLPL
ncbi:flagellar hook-length control protein [Mycolicibacterium sp. ELW1]|uniref:flagellar hook-length control protein n=1 Tax=Mycobacteriaceae TaxID=1762 RepID=UPI0011ED971C|nr:flagellar hook-length control protein [Mycobacterium sp. ELW1]QEN13748.1 flagellar hook-length control protein [Mycobacterium sp. ELW1]